MWLQLQLCRDATRDARTVSASLTFGYTNCVAARFLREPTSKSAKKPHTGELKHFFVECRGWQSAKIGFAPLTGGSWIHSRGTNQIPMKWLNGWNFPSQGRRSVVLVNLTGQATAPRNSLASGSAIRRVDTGARTSILESGTHRRVRYAAMLVSLGVRQVGGGGCTILFWVDKEFN